MTMSHEEYLKSILRDKKLKLERLYLKQQTEQAVFESKRDVYIEDVDSIEKQLAEFKK